METSTPRPQPWGSPACRRCRTPFRSFARDSRSGFGPWESFALGHVRDEGNTLHVCDVPHAPAQGRLISSVTGCTDDAINPPLWFLRPGDREDTDGRLRAIAIAVCGSDPMAL